MSGIFIVAGDLVSLMENSVDFYIKRLPLLTVKNLQTFQGYSWP